MTTEPNNIDQPFVPLLDERTPGEITCGYLMTCPTVATWHIMWDRDGENSLACDRHMAEVQRRWMYLKRHSRHPDCTMPGADWFPERCAIPAIDESAEATAKKVSAA